MAIRYREQINKGATVVYVYLDGRKVGTIYPNGNVGWHYQPIGRGNPPGDTFQSINAVKRSLEAE